MSRKPPERTLDQLRQQTKQQEDAKENTQTQTQEIAPSDDRTDEERFGGPLPGNLARQVVSTTQGGFDGTSELSPYDAQAEKERLTAIDSLKQQQEFYRGAGVMIARYPDKEPLTALTYSAYPNAEKGIQAGQPATHVFTDREIGADSLSVPADLAVKAVSCQRCNLSPDLHKEKESLCKRCFVGGSFHVKRGDVLLCRDNRPAELGALATEPLCPGDGGQGDFRYYVKPESKVQLKGVSPVMQEPVMREETTQTQATT